jgi:hypothetical protein
LNMSELIRTAQKAKIKALDYHEYWSAHNYDYDDDYYIYSNDFNITDYYDDD